MSRFEVVKIFGTRGTRTRDLPHQNHVVLTPLLSFNFEWEELALLDWTKKEKRPFWMINFSCILHMRRKIIKLLSTQEKLYPTAIPGLGLNPHHPNPKQRLQFQLNNDQTLRGKADLIIWHDIVSNTISRHPNPRNDPRKDYPAAHSEELCFILRSFKPRIHAILHCQRHGATSTYHKLLETGIQIIDVWQKTDIPS